MIPLMAFLSTAFDVVILTKAQSLYIVVASNLVIVKFLAETCKFIKYLKWFDV